MKSIFENVIKRGTYDLGGLLAKIDAYHIEGKLSDDDRDALYTMAQDGARPTESVDIMAKLEELDRRLLALEEAGGNGGRDEYPDYIAGHWYYRGDKNTFNGIPYVCIAPEGVVCVWSPHDKPDYWEQVDA